MLKEEKTIVETIENDEANIRFYQVFLREGIERLNNQLNEICNEEIEKEIEQKKFELTLKVAANMLNYNINIPTIISITGLTLK